VAYYKIDYYAFTIPTDHIFEGVNDEICKQVVQSFISISPGLFQPILQAEAFKIERATGFYTYRLRHEHTGIAISFGSVNAHLFVELSGKTCDNFDSVNALQPLIQSTCSRATRIDIAADFECKISPVDFAEERNKKRWKYAPFYPSASGETVYIGSRSGERMARVYRYNAPHPRAHFLRVECEYKGDAAKALASLPTLLNCKNAFDVASAPFGFTHPLFLEVREEVAKLPYRKNSEKNKNTVAWLYGAVISAMRKALAEDVVDFEEWRETLFKEHFTPEWSDVNRPIEEASNSLTGRAESQTNIG